MKNQPLAALGIASLTFLFSMPESVAQAFQSPEVHADNRVTVRLLSRDASTVIVDIAGRRLSLTKGDYHLWSVTTEPLSAGIHDYHFLVDGTRMIDPANRKVKKWFTLASMVEIPGDPPRLTEFQDVPHGVVQRLIYPSNSVGHPRPVMVYTPPDYHLKAETTYPLLILMHGFGDDETAWTEVGRAHLIADNLIAQQRIGPCIIAMPFGHPVPPPYGKRPEDYFVDNNEVYEQDIVHDLLPFLGQRFRLTDNIASRSLAGLSMGGGHAIHIGLRHTELFSSIGAFSAAAPQVEKEPLPAKYPAMFGENPAANQLQRFWIPIGVDDFLLKRNRAFVSVLKQHNVMHHYVETQGNHSWPVWRRYLPQFLEMIVPAQ